jgi:hypothetical protein
MKLALIAGLALAGLMQEAEASTSAGSAAAAPSAEWKEAVEGAAAYVYTMDGERGDHLGVAVQAVMEKRPEWDQAKFEAAVKDELIAIKAKLAAEEAERVAKVAADAAPVVAPNLADTSGDTEHQPAGAHLDAPAAKPAEGEAVAQAEPEKTEDEYANALAEGKPKVALVGKYADRIPVQLKSLAHLAQLKGEHGEGFVEVVS